MEICFITADTIDSVWQEKLSAVGKSDVLVFGFNGLGLVSYKKELGGETEYFQDLARLSRELSNVVKRVRHIAYAENFALIGNYRRVPENPVSIGITPANNDVRKFARKPC